MLEHEQLQDRESSLTSRSDVTNGIRN